MAGIPRLVIGCQDPVPENASEGAGRLHAAGVSVTMGILQGECQDLIKEYTALCNTKIQRMARQHMKRFGRVSASGPTQLYSLIAPISHIQCHLMTSSQWVICTAVSLTAMMPKHSSETETHLARTLVDSTYRIVISVPTRLVCSQ
jgi:hypothetical protein